MRQHYYPGLLVLLTLSLVASFAVGQQAAQQYKLAQALLKAHSSEDGILNDDSREAHEALAKMYSSAGQVLIEILTSNPSASPLQIDAELCRQGIAAVGCGQSFAPQHDIIRLGKDLYAFAVATETGGTVLVIGRQGGQFAQLWSLAAASVTWQQDPKDLIGAWLPDRTGIACRRDGSPHKPGSCGPLYSELGLLPPDAEGRSRFYIDAGYEQLMGATVGKQTSIWRWNVDHAELLWIDFYSSMIDQVLGTTFDNDKGTLHVGAKGEFATMFSCGSCIDKPLDRSILITKTGVEDLGVRSLSPELDRIDDLFQRLQKKQSTAGIAAPQVISFLRQGIVEAKRASRKIDPNWFSVGMIDSSLVKLTAYGADVCLEPDGEFGTMHFVLKRTANGGYYIEHVASAPKNAACSQGAFLPGEPATVPATQ